MNNIHEWNPHPHSELRWIQGLSQAHAVGIHFWMKHHSIAERHAHSHTPSYLGSVYCVLLRQTNINYNMSHQPICLYIFCSSTIHSALRPVLFYYPVFFIMESFCIWRGEGQQEKDDVDIMMHELHKRCHVCARSRQRVNFHPSKAVISLAVHLFLENNRVWK